MKLTIEQSCTLSYLDEMQYQNNQVVLGDGWTNKRTLKSLAKKGLIVSFENPTMTTKGNQLIIELEHKWANEHPEHYS